MQHFQETTPDSCIIYYCGEHQACWPNHLKVDSWTQLTEGLDQSLDHFQHMVYADVLNIIVKY